MQRPVSAASIRPTWPDDHRPVPTRRPNATGRSFPDRLVARVRPLHAIDVDRSRLEPSWSFERAVAVVLLPIVATALLVWAELQSDGTTVLSYAAGACYFLSPTIGAVAASRTMSPRSVIRAVAIIVAAILIADWVIFAPRPTQPGVGVGGSVVTTALVYAIGGSTVWYWAALIATAWRKRGRSGVGLAVGGAAVLGGSFIVILLAVLLPLP
jgi:hypothetical protein